MRIIAFIEDYRVVKKILEGRYLHKVCINYTTENIVTDFLPKIPNFLNLKQQSPFGRTTKIITNPHA
ncbi:MAG: hypothetical protein L6405_08460 [Actinomycetia bacterium]|nr:hypothetical protein [Actinomycetes bacterium]